MCAPTSRTTLDRCGRNGVDAAIIQLQHEAIVAGVSGKEIPAAATLDQVVAATPIELVVAVVADQMIGTFVAEHVVIDGPCRLTFSM